MRHAGAPKSLQMIIWCFSNKLNFDQVQRLIHDNILNIIRKASLIPLHPAMSFRDDSCQWEESLTSSVQCSFVQYDGENSGLGQWKDPQAWADLVLRASQQVGGKWSTLHRNCSLHLHTTYNAHSESPKRYTGAGKDIKSQKTPPRLLVYYSQKLSVNIDTWFHMSTAGVVNWCLQSDRSQLCSLVLLPLRRCGDT